MPEVNFEVRKGLTVPRGTAAVPSVVFDPADLNTGLYSPGADQVAISTNGAGRLFINSSGQVFANQTQQLSNTTSPTLELTGDVVVNASTTGASQTAGVNFYHLVSTSTATRAGARVESAAEAAYTAGSAATYDAGLRFYTSLDGSLAERLRITSAGLVGIGTSSPSTRLHVQDTSGSAQLRITGTGGYTELYSDGNFYIQPNGSTKMVVQSGGNVGIGTTSPGSPLDVQATGNGGASLNDGIRIYAANRSQYANFGYNGLNATNNLAFFIADTEAARIDSSRRLLVGTSTARANFYNSTGTPQVQVESTSSDGSSLSLTTNFTTATPTASPNLSLARSGATSLGSNTLVAANNTLGSIYFLGADGSEFVTAAQIQAFVDGTPGANDMPGRLVFSVTADGASSPTEAMRIKNTRVINFANAPTYADNTAALAGGLVAGDVYKKSDGTLMITY